ITDTLELARQLGAVIATFKGHDVVSTIATFVKEYGITHILMGRTERPWYRRWFGQSVLDRLLRTVRGVDVIVVDSADSRPRPFHPSWEPAGPRRIVQRVARRAAGPVHSGGDSPTPLGEAKGRSGSVRMTPLNIRRICCAASDAAEQLAALHAGLSAQGH